MHEESALKILLIIFFVPFMLLFANHEVYFVIMSFILLTISIKKLHMRIPGKKSNETTAKAQISKNLDDRDNIDIHIDKNITEKGLPLSGLIFTFTFFLYSSFYLHSFNSTIIIALAFTSCLYKIIEIIQKKVDGTTTIGYVSIFVDMVLSLTTILIIVMVSYNKFAESIF